MMKENKTSKLSIGYLLFIVKGSALALAAQAASLIEK
jgi:hypothetical protein